MQALAAVRHRDDAGAVPGLPAAPDRPPGGVILADRVPVADEAEQRGGGSRDDEGHQQGWMKYSDGNPVPYHLPGSNVQTRPLATPEYRCIKIIQIPD